jgi:hypothetical protein
LQEFISQHQSPGVFIVPQRIEMAAAIDELLLIWSASNSDEWTNRILYSPLSPVLQSFFIMINPASMDDA